MKRSTPLRKTPMRSKQRSRKTKTVGKYSGKIRLYGIELTALRAEVFARCHGKCEMRSSAECWGIADWTNGHMHHKIHRSLGGSDTLENCVWSCPSCHRKEHNQ